jgi:nitrite reductase/ring-hydroxylating ferredoxin subunit
MDVIFESPACRLDDIPDGGAKGLVLPDPDGRALRVIVLRSGAEVIAYRNRCPHRGTPLDIRLDDFLDRDGRHIVCSTHGAIFRREDGYCLAARARATASSRSRYASRTASCSWMRSRRNCDDQTTPVQVFALM